MLSTSHTPRPSRRKILVTIAGILACLLILVLLVLQTRSGPKPAPNLATPVAGRWPIVPFAVASRLGVQLSYSGGAYASAQATAVSEIYAAGVTVARLGLNLWDYAPIREQQAAARIRKNDAARIAQLSSMGYTVVLEVIVHPRPTEIAGADDWPVNSLNQSEFFSATWQLANSYKDAPYNVRWFEFDNEPDLTWYRSAGTSPDAKRDVAGSVSAYVAALRQFSNVIKNIDPQLGVIGGGVAYDRVGAALNFADDTTEPWLRQALKSGMTQYVDVLAWHFYPSEWYGGSYSSVASKAAAIDSEIALSAAPATSVTTWLNESGLSSDPCDTGCQEVAAAGSSETTPPVTATPDVLHWSEDVQAAQLVRMNVGGMGARLPNQVWFLLQDWGGNDEFGAFHHSGLLDMSGKQKPSFDAFIYLAKTLARAVAVDNVADLPFGRNDTEQREGYTFRNADGQLVSVLWSLPRDGASQYKIDSRLRSYLGSVQDIYGNDIPIAPATSTEITISLTNSPVYVTWLNGVEALP